MKFSRFIPAVLQLLLLCGAGCGKPETPQARTAELQNSFASSAAEPYVKAAVSALREQDYASSVIALQQAERLPGATAQQLMALQETMHAITQDLLRRADRGDAQAKAALAAIERTRSQ